MGALLPRQRGHHCFNGSTSPHYTELRKLGVSIMAPEYRGFGGLEGVPTEAALAADARAAHDYLRTVRKVPASRLVIYGWSLDPRWRSRWLQRWKPQG